MAQRTVVRLTADLSGVEIPASTGEPVTFSLDGTGARIFKEVTRENVGKRMAIVLVEKGKAEVITAPVIREEIGGGRVQISGRMTTRPLTSLPSTATNSLATHCSNGNGARA